jgi:putative oxidoreductase
MEKILRLHQTVSRFDTLIADWGGSLLNLAFRIYVGMAFFKAGMVKISDWDSTLALFHDEYMVPVLPPDLAAYMGASGELVFPLLLFVGVFSRPAALGLFFVNAMAVISYPALFMFECTAGLKDHFCWGAMLLVLFAFGPGRFSIDGWLAAQAKKR